MLLTIIALAHGQGKQLPNRRVEPYYIASQTLLENWPPRQRGERLDPHDVFSLLKPVAFHIFSEGRDNQITEHELKPLIERQVCEGYGVSLAEAKTTSRELLHRIEEHTGFFLERGFDQSGRRVYGFLHLTFAEYLTAMFLADQWSSNELDLAKYVGDDRWHEVLLLTAGHIGTWTEQLASDFIEDILELESPFEAFLHRNLLLAAEMLADNVGIRRKVQDDIVLQLMKLVLEGPFRSLRRLARRRLVSIDKVVPLGNIRHILDRCADDDPMTGAWKVALKLSLGERSQEALQSALQIGLEERDVRLEADWDGVLRTALGGNTGAQSDHLLEPVREGGGRLDYGYG